MYDYFYLVIACLLSIECILRFKFLFYLSSIAKTIHRIFHLIISANISDHWKEKMVPIYAFILLKDSLFILGILLLIFLVFFAFIVLSSRFLIFILSIKGIVISIFISVVYLKLRAILCNE